MIKAFQKILGRGGDDAETGMPGTSAGRSSVRHASAGTMIVGIFGKHRRTPEHLFDLGASAELTELKDVLYDSGIRAAVDQNAWKGLDGEDFLPFNHVLVASRRSATIVARIAATRDELGRSEFPMIVAAAQSGVDLLKTPRIFELVRATFHDAARATSLQQIHEIVAAHRQSALNDPPSNADFDDDVSALGELVGRPAFGLDGMGLIKVLYSLDRQMSGWVMKPGMSRMGSPAPAHMRVPGISDWPVESAALWARFFKEFTAGQRPPIMAFAEAGGRFVDVFVGDPSPTMLRCLHAAPTVMPDVTQIPYELDDAYIDVMKNKIELVASQADAARAKRDASSHPPGGDGAGGGGANRPAIRAGLSHVPQPAPFIAATEHSVSPRSTAAAPPAREGHEVGHHDDAHHVDDDQTTLAPRDRVDPPIEDAPTAAVYQTNSPNLPRSKSRRSAALLSWPIIVVAICIALLTVLIFALLAWMKHDGPR